MDKMTIIAGLTGLLIVLLVAGNVIYEKPEQRYESSRDMMDTYVNIIVYHTDEEEAKEIMDDAYARMAEIIAIADRFNASSEVSQLNTNGFVDNPSPELIDMITICIKYSEITGGAFDITILPLLDLWNPYSGAGPYVLFSLDTANSDALDAGTITEDIRTAFVDNKGNLSRDLHENATVTVVEQGQKWTVQSEWITYTITNTSTELDVTVPEFWYVGAPRQNVYINETKQFVGSDKITVAPDNDKISLEPGMSVTLDGMAKGYIVDAGLKVLEKKGIKRALIDAGGDIATLGTKPEGEKWVIGLRNPEDNSESVMEFEVSGKAVATSGNYERFFDDNKEVGHIMDPATGQSVFKASSSTIIAENATVADILATGIFVLGPVEGIQLVDALPGVEALLLGHDDPTQLFPSSGIDKYEIKN